MIAPSPDWIVQINNRNHYDIENKHFIAFAHGSLIAYDTGADDSREFPPPFKTSLGIPTVLEKNIARLVKNEHNDLRDALLGVHNQENLTWERSIHEFLNDL